MTCRSPRLDSFLVPPSVTPPRALSHPMPVPSDVRRMSIPLPTVDTPQPSINGWSTSSRSPSPRLPPSLSPGAASAMLASSPAFSPFDSAFSPAAAGQQPPPAATPTNSSLLFQPARGTPPNFLPLSAQTTTPYSLAHAYSNGARLPPATGATFWQAQAASMGPPPRSSGPLDIDYALSGGDAHSLYSGMATTTAPHRPRVPSLVLCEGGDLEGASPGSEMSDVVLTPPGTPAHLMATAQSELSILSLKTAFLDDALVLGMLSRVEELSFLIRDASSQIEALQAENLALKFSASTSLGGGSRRSPPGVAAAERADLSPPAGSSARRGWGSGDASVEAAWRDILPPITPLTSGLSQPTERFTRAVCSGLIDYRDVFPWTPTPDDAFHVRVEWLVTLLASSEQYAPKEGALRRGAQALTDIVSQEKRHSPRVVAVLNVVATAAVELCLRPQGNYLIQAAFGCGPDVRRALFDAMRPALKSIVSAQYGQHVVLNMIQREDMRAWLAEELAGPLLDDGLAFLGERGGVRVLEQCLKGCSREQVRPVYAKLASVMYGQWIDLALARNGCLVVQNLIELYPHNGDFSHHFLTELLNGVHLLAAHSHGSFVLLKLLSHPTLRSRTLLAVLLSVDPLCAGPEVVHGALMDRQAMSASHGIPSLSHDEWEVWVGRVCDGSTHLPSIVNAVRCPAGVALLQHIVNEAPTQLVSHIRKTLYSNAHHIRQNAHGRVALSLLVPRPSSSTAAPSTPSSSITQTSLSPPPAHSYLTSDGGLPVPQPPTDTRTPPDQRMNWSSGLGGGDLDSSIWR